MPRYFFDIDDDVKLTDDEGMALPDLKAARGEAARALAEAAKDVLPDGGHEKELVISVRDDTGAVVLTARLSFSTHPPF
jgi:hypothetical protein